MNSSQDELTQRIEEFRTRANNNPSVKKLVRDWNRLIEIRVDNTAPLSFFIRCENQAFLMEPADGVTRSDIIVSASEDVLLDILTGELNPTKAHIKGELQYSGREKDELVVDSILMLIWGY